LKIKNYISGLNAKYLLPAITSLLLIGYVLFFLSLNEIEEYLLMDQKELMKEINNSGYSILKSYYEMAQKGEISEEEAKELAKKLISKIRYADNNKEYLWIQDTNYIGIMHPFRKDLLDISLKNFKNHDGIYVFREFVNAVKDSGKGYLEYTWQYYGNTKIHKKKVAYVQLFEPWGWIIGNGVYIERVDKLIHSKRHEFAFYYSIIFMIILVFTFVLTRKNTINEKERLTTLDELRNSEEQFRAFAEQSVIGIIILKDQEVLYANHAIEENLGIPVDDLIHRNEDAVYELMELNKTSVDKEYLSENNVELKINTQSNKEIWLKIFSKNIYFAGDMAQLLMVADITANKTAEKKILELNKELETKVKERTLKLDDALQELREKNKELHNIKLALEDNIEKEKNLNKMKSEFISMVSHEYRTPLSSIQTSFDVIKQMIKKNNYDNIDTFLNNINQSINHMTEMLNNIVMLGNTDASNIKMSMSAFECYPYLISIFDSLNIDKRIEMNFNADKKLIIMSDIKLLRLIILNLVSNALKYSDGKINVQVYEDEQYLYISIQDHGIGISEEDMQNIYSPFFKTKKNSAIKQGTGLGLSIVKQSADALNIDITIKSELDVGTTFILKMKKKHLII
jgi:PAS domain S-box-containing protein